MGALIHLTPLSSLLFRSVIQSLCSTHPLSAAATFPAKFANHWISIYFPFRKTQNYPNIHAPNNVTMRQRFRTNDYFPANGDILRHPGEQERTKAMAFETGAWLQKQKINFWRFPQSARGMGGESKCGVEHRKFLSRERGKLFPFNIVSESESKVCFNYVWKL